MCNFDPIIDISRIFIVINGINDDIESEKSQMSKYFSSYLLRILTSIYSIC